MQRKQLPDFWQLLFTSILPIRLPHVTGKTDSERIEQIIRYLRELAIQLQRMQTETEKKI